MKRYLALLLLLSLWLTYTTTYAAVIRIPQDEASIQDGCDYSEPGDTIRVSTGTWHESILLENKYITLEGDTAHPEQYVINPTAGGSALMILGNLGGQMVVRGLTFTGGTGFEIGDTTYGGGIYCYGTSNSPLLLEKCIIEGNQADIGGGIYTRRIHPYAFGCRITDNTAEAGNAIYCEGSASNNYQMGFLWTVIDQNHDGRSVIELDSIAQTLMFRNCTVTRNSAENYLLFLEQSQADLQGTILWDNQSHDIYRSANRSTILFRYSLVEGGQQSVAGRIDQWTGVVVISPFFANPGASNYSLRRESPCIDVGYPYNTLDYDGSRSDMGAVPYLHHNRLIIQLVNSDNAEMIPDAQLTLLTPRDFQFQLNTDQNGSVEIYDYPDNSHTGTFELSITHPVFIDRHFYFQLSGRDTTLQTYTLSPANFTVTPQELRVSLPRGSSATRTIEVRNGSNERFDWAIQNQHGYTVVSEFEIEAFGRVEGAAFDGEYFYLPNYMPNSDREIFVLDREGMQVNVIPQPFQEGAGWRDIEWDGEHLWGIGDRRVYKITRDGDLVSSWNIDITGTSVTWDPDHRWIWITGPYSSIIAYDTQGNRIEPSLVRHVRMHRGMAYYPDDPQGYCLYFLTTANNDESEVVVKMNVTTQDTLMVGGVEDRVGYSMGFGLNVTNQYDVDGKAVWLTHQIDSTRGMPSHKLTLLKFNSTDDWLEPRSVKGVLPSGGIMSIDVTITTVTGETDTLENGEYSAELGIAFGLPSESLAIPIRLNVGPVNVEEQAYLSPGVIDLAPPFPNPFNSTLRMDVGVHRTTEVELSIYDLNGRLVETIADRDMPTGIHRFEWQAKGVPAGEYMVVIKADGKSKMTKVVLLK